MEKAGSLRFLTIPCARAALSDPGGTSASRDGDALVRPARIRWRRLPSTCSISGLNDEARALPVYASQPQSPTDHATLGYGGSLAFAVRDFHPRDRTKGFSSYIPLSQALPDAPDVRTYGVQTATAKPAMPDPFVVTCASPDELYETSALCSAVLPAQARDHCESRSEAS